MMELISNVGFEKIVMGALGSLVALFYFLNSRNKNKAAISTVLKKKLEIDNAELITQIKKREELNEEQNKHNIALINRTWGDICKLRSEGKTTLSQITDAGLREDSGKVQE